VEDRIKKGRQIDDVTRDPGCPSAIDIPFRLRRGVQFSDGTPFSAEDVAYTLRTLFDPKLHVPTADAFGASGAAVKIETPAADEVVVTFPAPVAGLATTSTLSVTDDWSATKLVVPKSGRRG